MNEEPIKICSSCGAEYSLRAEICADCGGKLVLPQDYEKRFVPLAEAEEKILIREGPVGYLQELEAQLKKKGIRAAIRFHGGVPGTCASKTVYGLYVATDDEAAAKEIDRSCWIKGAPDHASSYKYEEQELKGICPACSCAIPEASIECPECGLMVKHDEDVATCPDCDAEVGDEVMKCPNCGAEFE
jgi:predicted amidophosphoribosyltransferase